MHMLETASHSGHALLLVCVALGAGCSRSDLTQALPVESDVVGRARVGPLLVSEAGRSLLEGAGTTADKVRAALGAASLDVEGDLVVAFASRLPAPGRAPDGVFVLPAAAVVDVARLRAAVGALSPELGVEQNGDVVLVGTPWLREATRRRLAGDAPAFVDDPDVRRVLDAIDASADAWFISRVPAVLAAKQRAFVALGEPRAAGVTLGFGELIAARAVLALKPGADAEGLAVKARALLDVGARQAKNEHDATLFARASIDGSGDVIAGSVEIEAKRIWEMIAGPRMLLAGLPSGGEVRSEAARVRLQSLRQALLGYRIRYRTFPPTLETLADQGFIERRPLLDPSGRPYDYLPSDGGADYRLCWVGPDGVSATTDDLCATADDDARPADTAP